MCGHFTKKMATTTSHMRLKMPTAIHVHVPETTRRGTLPSKMGMISGRMAVKATMTRKTLRCFAALTVSDKAFRGT
jgi:hypothetical protein